MNTVWFQTEIGVVMAKANGIDGPIGFIRRDDVWRQRMFEVLAEHIGPAPEEFDLEFEDLSDLLGETWPMALWGCALEDLLGRTFGSDKTNIVDLYLGQRGWAESAADR